MLTPEKLRARNAAIKRAWDDPLLRQVSSEIRRKEGSKRSSREAYNAYMCEYLRRYRARRKASEGA